MDYFDYRIKTGKFIDDIKFLCNLINNYFTTLGKKLYTDTKDSNIFIALLNLFKTLLNTLMKLPLFALIFSLFKETIRIVISCYAEIFIIFAFTFPLTILLLNLFQTYIIAFFIGLIPILLLNIYCISALFNFIKHKESGEKISLWHSFHMLTPRFSAIIYPVLTQTAIIQESFLGFIIVSVFLSYTFELLHLSWSNSFIFWFIILILGFILVVGLFIFSIITLQTFLTVLLENLSFQQAIKESQTIVFRSLPTFFILYLILYIAFAFFISKMVVLYLYLGATIGMYCACIGTTFLAYLLWEKFRLNAVQPVIQTTQKPPFLVNVIIIFGFMNFILLAVFMINEYQPFINFVQQQEDNFLAAQQMRQYTNTTYGYSIQYPQAWTVYEWNEKSTTFYNNFTGTITGGTWMTITVSTYDYKGFQQLFTAAPGLVIEDGVTKDVTTKITNMSILGYDTVNYNFVKSTNTYPQYETHYLIHKGNLMYDIAFVSLSNDVSSYNSDLFQKIISSFQFIN